jgi:hypothetical protein
MSFGGCTAYRVRQCRCRLVADHDAWRESSYMYTCSARSYNRSEITGRIGNVGQHIPDSPIGLGYDAEERCFPQEVIITEPSHIEQKPESLRPSPLVEVGSSRTESKAQMRRQLESWVTNLTKVCVCLSFPCRQTLPVIISEQFIEKVHRLRRGLLLSIWCNESGPRLF